MPPEVEVGAHVVDLDFHPCRDVLATSDVTGGVKLCVPPRTTRRRGRSARLRSFTYNSEESKLALELRHHSESARCCRFAPSGNCTVALAASSPAPPTSLPPAALFTCSADKTVAEIDATGRLKWQARGAHESVAGELPPAAASLLLHRVVTA